IEAAKTKQDVLLDLATHPFVIHDEQIGPGTVGLRTNEQVGAPVSLSWITRRRITSTVFSYLQIRRDTRISRWQASPCLESTSCGQLASPTVEDEPEDDSDLSAGVGKTFCSPPPITISG